MRTPTIIGNHNPSKSDIKKFMIGEHLDFCNGLDIGNIPDYVILRAKNIGYEPADTTCLALHGRGCVAPHTDDTFGSRALVWVVKLTGEAHIMVGCGERDDALSVNEGDIFIFDAKLVHAWITNYSWALCVLDIDKISTEKNDSN